MRRQIAVQERVRRVGAPGTPPSRVRSTQPATAARLASLRAISAARPPMRSAQRSPSSASSTHSMRGRVDGVAGEDPLDQLAAGGQAEHLRQRPRRRCALQPVDRARRQREHAVRRLAAQHLLPGPGHHIEPVPGQRHGEGGGGGVADRQALRAPAGIQAPSGGRRTPEVVPFQANTTSRDQIDRREVGQRCRRARRARARPAASAAPVMSAAQACGEALERQHVDRRAGRAATTAPSRPRRCRRPGTMPSRQPAGMPSMARERLDHLGQPRLRLRRPVAAAEQGARERGRASSRAAWRRGRRRSMGWPGGYPGGQWLGRWWFSCWQRCQDPGSTSRRPGPGDAS